MLERNAVCWMGGLSLLFVVQMYMPASARADRGSIRSEPVNIEEPAQRAIIAHNGVREWLILQTDVRAEKATKIVEFMPLPAKPEVSLAPEGCFATLRALVEQNNLRYQVGSGRGKGAAGGGAADEPVKVVVSAQLGPHAVTVAEVKDADAFVVWVREFFHQNDLGEPEMTGELREVVADYLRRDLRFFAFDVVALSPETKTVQPLTYVFYSNRLYYPLVVTNLYGGQGTIELFTLLAPGLTGPDSARGVFTLRPHSAIEATRWRELRSGIARIPTLALAALHPDLPKQLEEGTASLWACKYDGPLRFEQDVSATLGYREPDRIAQRFLRAWAARDCKTLDVLTTTPFALADSCSQAVIFDREKLLAELVATNPSHAAADFTHWGINVRDIAFREFSDRYSRDFIIEYLRPGVDIILQCSIGSLPGDYYVLVQRTGDGFCRIVGLMRR